MGTGVCQVITDLGHLSDQSRVGKFQGLEALGHAVNFSGV